MTLTMCIPCHPRAKIDVSVPSVRFFVRHPWCLSGSGATFSEQRSRVGTKSGIPTPASKRPTPDQGAGQMCANNQWG